MSDKDESIGDKLERETVEKTPAEAVGDDLDSHETKEALDATIDQAAEDAKERRSDISPDESAERHWKADTDEA